VNIASVLEEQARRVGDRAAIIERGRRITFRELDRAAASAAADLTRAGVRPDMRALVFSQMSIDLYVTMIALFRLRVTAVFVDPSAGRERLDQCVMRVRPDAFVAIPKAHLLRFTSAAIRAIPIKAAIGGGVPFAATVGRRVNDSAARVEPCAPETPAIITFTSGSTGEPKAAVRTHGFLIAQHAALADSLELAAGEIDLCTLPIFLLANLASGVTSVIPNADLRAPGAIDPAPVDAQIRATQPTRTVASPAFIARLVDHANQHGRHFDTFRRVYTGGAPVFPHMLDAIAAVAPNASVVAVYGSTEAEPIAKIDRRDISAEDRAAIMRGAGLIAGPPASSIQLRILPDRWGTPISPDRWGTPVGPLTSADLERDALGPDAIGEIVVSGDHVLPGYLDGRGDEETKIKVGDRVWHRTGDAGYLDKTGRLWLLGRCSAKASDGDGVLYPLAVECAAGAVAGVGRTAFVMHRGRRLLAAEATGDAAAVRAELMKQLAWARLADVVIVARIPVDRRHNAKVEYPELHRLLDEGWRRERDSNPR
jgi:acyl-CoA synthetase (AMP-forming)/AMP-acid ligase II